MSGTARRIAGRMGAMLVALSLLSGCGGPAEEPPPDPAAMEAARTALTEACLAGEETAESCGCYVDRVAKALSPTDIQILARGDAASPEEQGDLARKPNYAEVVTAQATCLING